MGEIIRSDVLAYHISDTHFYHNNIIRYCNRPFQDTKEMNDYIIKSWNSVVKENDIVYHHGDFALKCGKEMVRNIANQLNGNIILITGNHDKRSRGWFLDCGFVKVYKKPIQVGRYILSHQPLENVEYGLINIHGHIHNYDKGLDKDKYINVSCEFVDYKPVWIDIIKKG